MYVEITVTEPADFFLLRINDCWATQNQQANASEGLVHSLLLNGLKHLCIEIITLDLSLQK